jgi:hypothetical protein
MPAIKEKKLKKRKEIKRPWWYITLRSMHYYAYKYWAIFLLGFFILLALCIWLCYLPYCEKKEQCCLAQEYIKKVQTAEFALEKCCACSSTVLLESEDIDELRRDYGGSIGEVTITLAWQTTDDLDLHIVEPSGEIIYFENKISSSGGQLDIDKNADDNLIQNPIENVFYALEPPRGKYRVYVHYYGSNSGTAGIPYKVYINVGGEQKQLNGTHHSVGDMHAVYEFIIP